MGLEVLDDDGVDVEDSLDDGCVGDSQFGSILSTDIYQGVDVVPFALADVPEVAGNVVLEFRGEFPHQILDMSQLLREILLHLLYVQSLVELDLFIVVYL